MNVVDSSRKLRFPEILDNEHREIQEFYSQQVDLRPPADWLPDDVLYGYLQTTRTASTREIYKIYKKLSRSKHPDKITNSNSGDENKSQKMVTLATSEFQRIQKAWGVISNPIDRKIYDMFGLVGLQHKKSLLKNAIFKDEENPKFLELIIAAGLFNKKIMYEEETAGVMIDITQKISIKDVFKTEVIEYFDENGKKIESEIPSIIDRISFTNFESFRLNAGIQPIYQDHEKQYRFNFVLINDQAIYALGAKHTINVNHDLEGRMNFIAGANPKLSSIAESSFIYTYKSGGSTYPWQFTSEIPAMFHLEDSETLNSAIVKPSGFHKPIVKFTLPILKPSSTGKQLKMNASIQLDISKLVNYKIFAQSMKISFDYSSNVEPGLKNINKFSIQNYKISPFVKFTPMAMKMGKEANIYFTNGINLEIDTESESKAVFQEVRGRKNLVFSPAVTSGSVVCNLPLGKTSFAKFGIKMDSGHKSMDKNGSIIKSQSEVRLLIGFQVSRIGFTVPLEIPNEAVYIATGLACVGGLGYGLYKWFKSDENKDFDDVLKEDENQELEKLTKKYRDLFKQKKPRS